MTKKQEQNRKITFKVSYYTSGEISLYYTEIMFIEYRNRGVWLIDCRENRYRLQVRSLNQLKKTLMKEYRIYRFYSLRDALIPTHYIEQLKITEWTDENEIILQRYIEINKIPIPKNRLKDYFDSSKS